MRYSATRGEQRYSQTREGDHSGSHLAGQLRLPREVHDPRFVPELERYLRRVAKAFDNFRYLIRNDHVDRKGRVGRLTRFSTGASSVTENVALQAEVPDHTVSGTKTITSSDSPYDWTGSDWVLLVDTSGGSVTVNVPTAVNKIDAGRRSVIKTSASNTLTLDCFGSETLDGSATVALTSLGDSRTLVSDDSNWWSV